MNMRNFKEINIAEKKDVNVSITCIDCGVNFSSSIDVVSTLKDSSYNSGSMHCHECEKEYKYETYATLESLKIEFLNLEEFTFDLFYNQDSEVPNPDAINDEPPYCYKNAFMFYNKQIENLRSVNAVEFSNKLIQQTNNRLVFSGIITSFETFVKEVIYYLVFMTDWGLRIFVENYSQYKNEKILLKEIFIKNDVIHRKVMDDLDKISFHNLPIVINLFKIYDINISNFEGKKEIVKSIKLRHDVVHRSGVDNNNSLIIIKKDEINKTIKLFDNYVSHINKQTNNGLSSIGLPF